uniref:Putative secreted protein n=1 Tax=Ixodes ricinus TaxID=34613 RepID=A0A6B0URA7_IXORI
MARSVGSGDHVAPGFCLLGWRAVALALAPAPALVRAAARVLRMAQNLVSVCAPKGRVVLDLALDLAWMSALPGARLTFSERALQTVREQVRRMALELARLMAPGRARQMALEQARQMALEQARQTALE